MCLQHTTASVHPFGDHYNMRQRLGNVLASCGALCTDAAWWQQQTLISTLAAQWALPADPPSIRNFPAQASHQLQGMGEKSRKVYIQTYGGYWANI